MNIAVERITCISLDAPTASGTSYSFGSTKVGFFGANASQASAYTQTYSTATKTHNNISSSAVTTTAATNITPYGYTTQAQADAIVTAINAVRTDLTNLKGLVNSIIDDLQAYGLLT